MLSPNMAEVFAQKYLEGFKATIKFLLSRNYCYSIQDAEEIAQAAWVRGFANLHQIRDTDMIIQWVHSIAKNLARSNFRGLKNKKHADLQKVTVDPVDLLHNQIAVDKLLTMKTLDARDRHILGLTYRSGMSTDEIRAIHPEMAKTTIRVVLHRARQKIYHRVNRNEMRPH